ncbi:MAG: helicase [Planctomycetaceae bacterium]|nr:helicase [Planctomycetaceae bacterium]
MPRGDGMALTVEQILGPDGLIAQRLGGYEHRREQLDMAQAVATALDDREHLIVEAGTGVGKSFAYLVPAILAAAGGEDDDDKKLRVIVSTYTIALQDQLITKDLPFLREVLPIAFTAELAKGRSNYLCFRRLGAVIEGRDKLLTLNEHEQLEPLAQWAMGTQTGTLQEIDFELDRSLWSRVCSDRSVCRGAKCSHNAKCFLQAARRRVQKADIVVVNHAMFFSDLALRKRGGDLLGDYDVVILDEAHTVEAVVSDHFGRCVTSGSVQFLLRDLFDERTGRGLLALANDQGAINAVIAADAAAGAFFEALADYRGEAVASSGRISQAGFITNPLTPALKELAEALKRVTGSRKDETAFEIGGARDKAIELADEVADIVDQTEPDHAYWVTLREARGRTRRRAVTLASAPIDVSPIVRDLVFHEVKSAILTSATLATARAGKHGFDYIRSRLGLEEGRELLLASPFDFRRQAKLYIETGLGDVNDPISFIPAAARAIEHYVELSQGRCFVLLTSYQMLNAIAGEIEPFCHENEYQLLAQGGPLSQQAMLRRFRSEGRSVLLGTMSFWQGVDVAGDALQNVIIAKLPFAVPNEPIIEARIETIRRSGGNPFNAYQLPEAVIRFKQGFGRLIRSSVDTGFVVCLDHRIVSKPYGKAFIQALPDIAVAMDEWCKSR